MMRSGGREAELTVKIYVDQWLMINGVINTLLLLLLKGFIGLPGKKQPDLYGSFDRMRSLRADSAWYSRTV